MGQIGPSRVRIPPPPLAVEKCLQTTALAPGFALEPGSWREVAAEAGHGKSPCAGSRDDRKPIARKARSALREAPLRSAIAPTRATCVGIHAVRPSCRPEGSPRAIRAAVPPAATGPATAGRPTRPRSAPRATEGPCARPPARSQAHGPSAQRPRPPSTAGRSGRPLAPGSSRPPRTAQGRRGRRCAHPLGRGESAVRAVVAAGRWSRCRY